MVRAYLTDYPGTIHETTRNPTNKSSFVWFRGSLSMASRSLKVRKLRRYQLLRSPELSVYTACLTVCTPDVVSEIQDDRCQRRVERTRARLLAGASVRHEVQRRRDGHAGILCAGRSASLCKGVAHPGGCGFCRSARV